MRATFSSIFCNYSESGWSVHGAVAQAGTVCCHMTTVNSINIELEWTSCNRESTQRTCVLMWCLMIFTLKVESLFADNTAEDKRMWASETEQIFTEEGSPGMWLPSYLMSISWRPRSVGEYFTVTVPSLLSVMWGWAIRPEGMRTSPGG